MTRVIGLISGIWGVLAIIAESTAFGTGLIGFGLLIMAGDISFQLECLRQKL